ncbi:RDD family protein [Nocardioides islandensis]|uniref:RDD family protein n=1 Tax=Nocardioides islandensis TaxID=433663 RepID=A0A930VIV9_9ACTN|nr:RDD family protein [Nocardioides islandensis]MBF4765352.1 RDD family protein [Nocardioides islandensis]
MSHPEFATLSADDLVTGEAVALDLPPASLGLRMASGLVDVLATVALLLVVIYTFLVAALQSDAALAQVAFVGTLVVVFLVFPTTVETLSRGKSLGKWAFGLRTVRDDAGPISFQHAFVRALVGFVETYATGGWLAFFSSLMSERGKRLGDYAAGTYVVRERVRLHLAPPPPMPPELADWARRADVVTLPTALALAVRQFLQRAASLEPGSRATVGAHLAQQVSAYVAPPPPPGHAPETFLAAVVATGRERDEARLGRERAFRERLTARRG